jgi:hypothetical protein
MMTIVGTFIYLKRISGALQSTLINLKSRVKKTDVHYWKSTDRAVEKIHLPWGEFDLDDLPLEEYAVDPVIRNRESKPINLTNTDRDKPYDVRVYDKDGNLKRCIKF